MPGLGERGGEARVIVVRMRDIHNECPPLREVLWPVLAACQGREPVAEELIRWGDCRN